jgi:hypothetical protein
LQTLLQSEIAINNQAGGKKLLKRAEIHPDLIA